MAASEVHGLIDLVERYHALVPKIKSSRQRLALQSPTAKTQAKFHGNWPSRGSPVRTIMLIMWDTSPVQASLHKRLGDRWGPACHSAHQAPPRPADSGEAHVPGAVLCLCVGLATVPWFPNGPCIHTQHTQHPGASTARVI